MPMAKTIQNYYHVLRKGEKIKVTCPISACPQPHLTLSKYVSHAQECHGIDPKTQCPFCWGNYSWPRQQKIKHAVHLNACVVEFKRKHSSNWIVDRTSREDMLHTDICPCVNWVSTPLNNHTRSPEWADKGFYDALFEEHPSWWTHVGSELWRPSRDYPSFTDESGLGSDIGAFVDRYTSLGSGYRWAHVFITARSFEQFHKFREIRDAFVVLPFWCLCDGLLNAEGQPEHHRHMMVVYAVEGEFEKYWKTHIKCPGIKAKAFTKIETLQNLANTINYVCQSQMTCNGTLATAEEGTSHYHVNRPFYPHAHFALGTLFKNGLKAATRFRLLKKRLRICDDMDERCDENGDLKYAVPLRTTCLNEVSNCPLPLKEYLEPDGVETGPRPQPFLWLWGDRTMPLRINLELLNMTKVERYQRQKERGNAFLNAIQDEYYTLSVAQTRAVQDVLEMTEDLRKQMLDGLEKLEKSNAEMEKLRLEERQTWLQDQQHFESQLAQKERELAELWEQKQRELAELAEQKDCELAQKDRLAAIVANEMKRVLDDLKVSKDAQRQLRSHNEYLINVEMKRLTDELERRS